MRAARLMFHAALLAGAVTAARANPPCAVPDDLAMRDLALPAAKQAIAASHKLVILTLGGATTAGVAAGDPTATYPARLQAELTAALPGVSVSVINNAKPDNTVEAAVPTIPALIAATGAKIVIWAPGGHDAVRRPNLDGFFSQLEVGLKAIRANGAEPILMDMQYVPMLEQFSRIEDYRDLLRGAASASDVPLFPRHELMRAWYDSGDLDLDATDKAAQTRLIRNLFACLAKALAVPIAEAVH